MILKNSYYRMKVNNGNSYYSYFRDGGSGGLWIGWSKDQCDNIAVPGISKKEKANKRELSGILDCLKKYNQSERRIIFIWDREKQEICFWEIAGDTLLEVPQELKDTFPSDVRDHIMRGQIIPARLLANVPRSSFPAFIDSLSVYFYLNVGTFRPLVNVGQLERKTLHLFDKETNVGSQFSSVVSKYFDWVLQANETKSFSDFYKLEPKKLQELILTYMSPAQLESFGSLLLLDLGFTIEIGIGKSQDDFDLRGTFRHKKDKKKIFEMIMKKLEETLKVRLSESIKINLSQTGTVFVQCKNYSVKSYNDKILFFSQISSDKDPGENLINLNTFTDDNLNLKDNFPLVWDWLEQAINFFETPRDQLVLDKKPI